MTLYLSVIIIVRDCEVRRQSKAVKFIVHLIHRCSTEYNIGYQLSPIKATQIAYLIRFYCFQLAYLLMIKNGFIIMTNSKTMREKYKTYQLMALFYEYFITWSDNRRFVYLQFGWSLKWNALFYRKTPVILELAQLIRVNVISNSQHIYKGKNIVSCDYLTCKGPMEPVNLGLF